MELTKCDRCGKVYRGKKPKWKVGWAMGFIGHSIAEDSFNFDLCSKCAPRLVNYVKKYLKIKKKKYL